MEWLCKEEPYPRYECSNCGYSFTTVNRFSNERFYKFCPECGARNKEKCVITIDHLCQNASLEEVVEAINGLIDYVNFDNEGKTKALRDKIDYLQNMTGSNFKG